MSNLPLPFSNMVRDCRAKQALSLQQVADAAGLTKAHVWELERGKRVNPTVQTLAGLADVFQISPATLLRAAIEQLKARKES